MSPAARPQPDQEHPDLADELWTSRHLARYLHCGRSTVFLTVAEPGFPAALVVRATSGRRLWVAAEVRAWTERLPRAPHTRRPQSTCSATRDVEP
jgi:predicted DNA-binding transcriptional regulator AlpA